jgi:PKD repeat protein
MKAILYMCFVLAVFAACSTLSDDADYAPITNYAVTNANCKAPCAVLFTNTTRGGLHVEYSWDFGDGSTSSEANPRHYYTIGGDYNVKLTAKNKLGFNFLEKKVSIQKDLPLNLFELCRIDKITYIKVPQYKPDGSTWDNLPGNQANPELQWLVRDTNRVYITGMELAELVDFQQNLLPFTVHRSGGGSVRQFTQVYNLIIQDADVNGEDIIGSFPFRPLDYFPVQSGNTATNLTSEFKLTSKEGLEIIVYLSWF